MNKAAEKLDKVIVKINETLLVIALALMFVLVFANVVGRYFFSFTYYWIDELSRYLMISLAFLGMGLAMRKGSHSSFNILQNALSDKMRKILRFAVLLIILVSIAGFCYLGLLYALRSMNNRTESLRWRTGYWYMMIPLGSLLFIWHTLFIAKEYINQSRQADTEREIAAGSQMVDDSEFLKGIAFNVTAGEEKK
jgi:TRAP-type C4-dicarboxylate transport system permease small subunit